MELNLNEVLNIFVIPLYIWMYLNDRRTTKLEASQITKEDLNLIYIEVKDIKEEIHNLDKKIP